jgi:hypothetical protein
MKRRPRLTNSMARQKKEGGGVPSMLPSSSRAGCTPTERNWTISPSSTRLEGQLLDGEGVVSAHDSATLGLREGREGVEHSGLRTCMHTCLLVSVSKKHGLNTVFAEVGLCRGDESNQCGLQIIGEAVVVPV